MLSFHNKLFDTNRVAFFEAWISEKNMAIATILRLSQHLHSVFPGSSYQSLDMVGVGIRFLPFFLKFLYMPFNIFRCWFRWDFRCGGAGDCTETLLLWRSSWWYLTLSQKIVSHMTDFHRQAFVEGRLKQKGLCCYHCDNYVHWKSSRVTSFVCQTVYIHVSYVSVPRGGYSLCLG